MKLFWWENAQMWAKINKTSPFLTSLLHKGANAMSRSPAIFIQSDFTKYALVELQ
jgi:hypothetical protein